MLIRQYRGGSDEYDFMKSIRYSMRILTTLRIKTKDNNGNVSAGTYAAFYLCLQWCRSGFGRDQDEPGGFLRRDAQ